MRGCGGLGGGKGMWVGWGGGWGNFLGILGKFPGNFRLGPGTKIDILK